jgi:hypothetical protein
MCTDHLLGDSNPSIFGCVFISNELDRKKEGGNIRARMEKEKKTRKDN